MAHTTGGGGLARYAAATIGMPEVPGVALNRHCAGSPTSIGMASAQERTRLKILPGRATPAYLRWGSQ